MENLENQHRKSNDTENSLNFIKVSCPNCLKLFNVNPNEITETRPKFQCNACEKRFWIAYPESLEQPNGVIGFPVDWAENSTAYDATPSPDALQKPFLGRDPLPDFNEVIEEDTDQNILNCEKCGAEYKETDKECPGCSIIFKKYEEQKARREIPASDAAREAWNHVFENYESSEAHQRFVKICKEHKCLPFAAFKYKGIAEACPSDEITRNMMQQVEALALMPLENKKANVVEAPPKKNFKLPFRISSLLILLCGVVIMMGFLFPNSRNLIGIGTSALFIVLAIRFYFRLF